MKTSHISSSGRLVELDRDIAFGRLLLSELEGQVSQYLADSDAGWLLSMLMGPPGTVLAVARGAAARELSDKIKAVERKLRALEVERQVLRAVTEVRTNGYQRA